MSEAPNLNEILESAILLFFKTLYDFNPYLRNPDEQERLINMPNNVKTILREIITSEIFIKLVLSNESKKAEEKAREKALRREKRKKQLIEGIKSFKNLQGENYESNLKLIKNTRSLNTSCFNQRSISTLNQYYNSVNELICIKNIVLNKIQKIQRESVISKDTFLQEISEQKKSKIKSSNESKYKSSAYGSIMNPMNDMMLSRGFMSLENYYKYVKKKLDKINEEQNEIKEGGLKKKLKLELEEKKSKKEQRIKVYNTETREILPVIKKHKTPNTTRMNYVLLNKDVKYQFKRTNFINNKKYVNKEKQHYLPYKNFDYKNILSLFK